jgi:hypothetical protein
VTRFLEPAPKAMIIQISRDLHTKLMDTVTDVYALNKQMVSEYSSSNTLVYPPSSDLFARFKLHNLLQEYIPSHSTCRAAQPRSSLLLAPGIHVLNDSLQRFSSSRLSPPEARIEDFRQDHLAIRMLRRKSNLGRVPKLLSSDFDRLF